MWQQYRKTLIPMQIFILAASITAYFLMGRLWLAVLLIFLVMQLGALAGAAWGARLGRKAIEADETLPLQRRRR